jgi:hypothetical protein
MSPSMSMIINTFKFMDMDVDMDMYMDRKTVKGKD